VTFYRARIASWLRRLGTTHNRLRPSRLSRCPLYLGRELRLKAYATRARVEEWLAYHYAWREWLPAVWYRLARCETHVRWDWDSGKYVSAFGIYRAGYSDDAHRIGHLGWDETVRKLGRLPTPREQYLAALSHFHANGGFSGWGCRGA
jgi:hypothetical protein